MAQLDAALQLYFTTDNHLAIHTLVAAAYNVLTSLAKIDGTPQPFLITEFVEDFHPETQSSIRKWINAPENFLKHADRDPHDIHDFDNELTEILLIDAMSYFREKSIRPMYYDVFVSWFGNPRADLTAEEKEVVTLIANSFRSLGKKKFWDVSLERLKSKRDIT